MHAGNWNLSVEIEHITDPARQIAALESQAERRVMGANGEHITWRAFGNGSPLVLLHGGHGSWLHWFRNIPVLASSFRVWAPDMPGFGESDLPAHLHSMDGLVRRLAADIRTLAVDVPVLLAGFSFGGLVSSRLAAAFPDQVECLALIGAGGHEGGRRDSSPLKQWRDLPDEAAERAALASNLRAQMLSTDDAVDAVALEIHVRSCRATRFRSRPIVARGGLPAALDQAAKPTLLAWGRDDVTCNTVPTLERLTSGHAERQPRLIEHAGHWVQYEQADEINEALLRFLSGASLQGQLLTAPN